MKPIQLPVLCHDDTSKSLEELGIKYNLGECDTKLVTFYTINCIAPYLEGEFTGTHIFTGNTIFVCPFSYDRVITHVNEAGA